LNPIKKKSDRWTRRESLAERIAKSGCKSCHEEYERDGIVVGGAWCHHSAKRVTSEGELKFAPKRTAHSTYCHNFVREEQGSSLPEKNCCPSKKKQHFLKEEAWRRLGAETESSLVQQSLISAEVTLGKKMPRR